MTPAARRASWSLGLALVGGPALLGLVASGCGSSSGGGGDAPANVHTLSPANGRTLPATSVGAVYSQVFTVTAGGRPPYTFTPNGVPDVLPPGLTLTRLTDRSAALSGSPTEADGFAVVFQVTDADGGVSQLRYPLVISEGVPALTLSPSALSAPTLGVPYSASISETGGGTGPYTWSIASGQLPTGLTLDGSMSNTVTIAGTPTASGTFSFTLMARDSTLPQRRSGSRSYTLTVP